MKKVICRRCGIGTVAYISGEKTRPIVEITRGQKSFTILGSDFSILASCPVSTCGERTRIEVLDGQLQGDDLSLRDTNQVEKKEAKKIKPKEAKKEKEEEPKEPQEPKESKEFKEPKEKNEKKEEGGEEKKEGENKEKEKPKFISH